MKYNDIEIKYLQGETLIAENKIAKALNVLKDLLEKHGRGDLLSESENLTMNYKYLIIYNISGTKDPNQHEIYTKIKRSILEVFDKLIQDSLFHSPDMHLFKSKLLTVGESLSMSRVNEILDQMGILPDLDHL